MEMQFNASGAPVGGKITNCKYIHIHVLVMLTNSPRFA